MPSPVEICGHDNLNGCVPMVDGELFGAICTPYAVMIIIVLALSRVTPSANHSSVHLHHLLSLVLDLHSPVRARGGCLCLHTC